MYVTLEYYYDTFKGEPVDDADFSALCERAGEIIEEMTMYRLSEASFASMQEDMQERIKKAVCAQIEFLEANGGSDVDNGVNLQSAALGKFSYTKAAETDGAKQTVYAPRSQRLLWPTGLLYRGGRI